MATGNLARRPAVLLALALCAVGGMVTLLGRLATGPAVELKKTALTSAAGSHAYPAFSPDGNRLAYSEHDASKNAPYHIFVRPLPGGTPLQVTAGTASDIGPAWSPDGASLAFLRIVEERAQVIVIPSGGGVERKVVEFDAPASTGDDSDVEIGPSVSWTRDGRTLVVSAVIGDREIPALATVPAEGGALLAMTKPPAGSHGDIAPVVSPDGKSVAFVRKSENDRADIYLCDLKGNGVRQLTFDNHAIRGLAWTAGGQDLVYGSNRNTGWRLWRVPAYGGSPRDLLVSGNHASFPAVAPAGNRLAFTESPSLSEVWLAELGPIEPERERPLLRSSGREESPAFSPDGKRIANISDQSGEEEVWVTEADGTRNQITRLETRQLGQPQWSPDGKTLLFIARGPNGFEAFTVPAAGGKATRVLTFVNDASWSHDGKSIYYAAMNGEIRKAAADGSNPQTLFSRRGAGSDPHESADGKYVYYRSRRAIWRVPSSGGDGEEAFVPERDLMWGGLQTTPKGIYYLEFSRSGRAPVVAFYDFAAARSHPVVRLEGMYGGYSLSPDGKYVLYAKVDRNETNLQVVENFR